MRDEDEWIEAWRGNDPKPPATLLDRAGIEMRLASGIWCGFSGGISLINIFRRGGTARLLVRREDAGRAREALKTGQS